jgi:hypothetical protein
VGGGVENSFRAGENVVDKPHLAEAFNLFVS